MEHPVVDEILLSGASALDAAKAYQLGGSQREVAVYILFGPGTTAGAVAVESASDPTFAGTWENLVTVAWVAADREHIVQLSGVLRAVRTRISTAIAGGTVTTRIVAN
jgi:hypothetical protein